MADSERDENRGVQDVVVDQGFDDMLGAPVERCWAGGHSAAHINAIITVPATAANRSATPAITATPMASSPSMNSQFTQASPAMPWKVDCNGPAATPLKKPLVGEPPSIQPLPEPVAYPHPNVLSRKAQRKTNPVRIRTPAKTMANAVDRVVSRAATDVAESGALRREEIAAPLARSNDHELPWRSRPPDTATASAVASPMSALAVIAL